jgi:hypothetical protein
MITSALTSNAAQIAITGMSLVGKTVGRGMGDNMWEKNIAGVKDEIESLVDQGELELKEGEEPKDLLKRFCGSMMEIIFKEAAENMNTAKLFEEEDGEKAGHFR